MKFVHGDILSVNMTGLGLFSVFLVIIVAQARHLSVDNNLEPIPWHHGHHREHHRSHNVCETPGCKRAAESIKLSLNTSVDPCEDFYEFSCGGWMHNHPIPPTESQLDQFNIIDRNLNSQLQEIYEEDEDPNDPEAVNWAKTFYRTCMDTDHARAVGINPLLKLLEELGGWPLTTSKWDEDSFSWQETLAKSFRRYSVQSLITILVVVDRKNSTNSVLTVDQAMGSLPCAMLTEPSVYSKHLQSYVDVIVKCASEIAQAGDDIIPQKRIRKEAKEIVQFETELAKIKSNRESRRDPYRMYNAMSLKQLQKWSDTATLMDTDKRVIDWLSLLNNVFSEINTDISYNERIIVKETEFIIKLIALLQHTPKRILANYMIWRVISVYADETSESMRDIFFEFNKVFSGAMQNHPREVECVDKASKTFMFPTGYKYVQKHFDAAAKQSAMTMVKHIRDAFKARVAENFWMDEATKDAAIDKADAMTQFIGFPDWSLNATTLNEYYREIKIGSHHFDNLLSIVRFIVRKMLLRLRQPVDRNEWVSGPAVVNAFYNTISNSITFPAGILQAPFFEKDQIEALNYGSIGVIIGHEITHGFDDMGREIDKFGNMSPWWSSDTIAEYLKLAKCFVNQYDAYRVPELDEMFNGAVSMNGITTQGENIADNGGVRQAYHAYRRWVQEHGPEPKLPGLPFSPDQLFFLGFSTVWCETSSPQSLLRSVLSDSHAPHRYRVLGSLANSPEFAAVWECTNDSRMHPEKKCRIW